jgi:hypothetical protein
MFKFTVLMISLLSGLNASATAIKPGADCVGIVVRGVEQRAEGITASVDMKKVSFQKKIYVAVSLGDGAGRDGSGSSPELADWYPASSSSAAEAIYQGDSSYGWERIQLNYNRPVNGRYFTISVWVTDANGNAVLSCVNNKIAL